MNLVSFGKAGESLAAAFLEKNGYWISERNYRCRAGEIDLIAEKDHVLHFIEVKTRSSDRYGSPAEAVTETTQQHLRKAAAFYLKERKPEEDFYSFDVIEISLRHLKGVM